MDDQFDDASGNNIIITIIFCLNKNETYNSAVQSRSSVIAQLNDEKQTMLLV